MVIYDSLVLPMTAADRLVPYTQGLVATSTRSASGPVACGLLDLEPLHYRQAQRTVRCSAFVCEIAMLVPESHASPGPLIWHGSEDVRQHVTWQATDAITGHAVAHAACVGGGTLGHLRKRAWLPDRGCCPWLLSIQLWRLQSAKLRHRRADAESLFIYSMLQAPSIWL
jgi:hypothetical protein